MIDKKNAKKIADEFLIDGEVTEETQKLKEDKSLVERINKKIITEDGRQLLF